MPTVWEDIKSSRQSVNSFGSWSLSLAVPAATDQPSWRGRVALLESSDCLTDQART